MYYVKPPEENPEEQHTMTSKDFIVNNPVTVVSQPSQQEIAGLHIHHVGEGFDPTGLFHDDSEEGKSVREVFGNAEKGAEESHTETTETSEREEVIQREKDFASSITSGQIKISEADPEDLEDFMRASIIARPLNLPNMLDLRSKDPNYRLRWVNFKTKGGARFDEAVAQGFIKVTEPREVIGLNTHLMIHKDGIRYHDVILMKMKTEILFGAYKYNVIRSAQMVSRKGAQKIGAREANTTLRQGISNEGFSYNRELASKIGVYIPREDEGPNI